MGTDPPDDKPPGTATPEPPERPDCVPPGNGTSYRCVLWCHVGPSGGGGGGRAAEGGVNRVVIGKVADLTAEDALGPGERTLLDQLPDLGSPAANWAQNSGVLRQERWLAACQSATPRLTL